MKKTFVLFLVALLIMSSFASAGFLDLITGKANNIPGAGAEDAVSGADAQKQVVANAPVAPVQSAKKPGLLSRLFGRKASANLPSGSEGKELLGNARAAVEGVSDCVQACNDKHKKCLAAGKPDDVCAKAMQECKKLCKPEEAAEPAPTSPPAATPSVIGFQKAEWECYDGAKEVQGGETSCKPVEVWAGYAKEWCKGKCSAETAKCGVNSFTVYHECGTGCRTNADCAAGYACNAGGECVAY